MKILALVLLYTSYSIASAPPPDPIAEGCLKELETKTGDAAMTANVREAFTPSPDRSNLGDLFLKRFPDLIAQKDNKLFLKGTDVQIHYDDDVQKRYCASGGPMAAYATFEGSKGIFMCGMASKTSTIIDVFQHESIHALQFNMQDGAAAPFNSLFKFTLPDGQVHSADQLSQYTMPARAAQGFDSANGNFSNVYEAAAKSLTGSADDIKKFLNPNGFGVDSVLNTLNTTGVIETVSGTPLKLKWTPRLEAEGGEAKYKKQLLTQVTTKHNCPANAPQTDPTCSYLDFAKTNCPAASSNTDATFSCFKNYANRGLLGIETIANSNEQNLSSVKSMLDIDDKNSCFGISSYCSETQAHSDNGVAEMVRYLNARKLGLSEACQSAAIRSQFGTPEGKQMFDKGFAPLAKIYDEKGWAALQDAVIAHKTKMLEMGYGSWAQSALSGFSSFTPAICKNPPTSPKSCLWRTPEGSGSSATTPARVQ